MLYPFLRNCLFKLSPEKAHSFSMSALELASNIGILQHYIKEKSFKTSPSLERNLWGLHFKNPVGLAAGFDKNALYMKEIDMLGFGYMEVGTVTPKAQPGNPAPRLFRLPADKALINRMGFNNEGVTEMAKRLYSWHEQKSIANSHLVIGGNIGKNKITANEDAWKDYETCFRSLFEVVDYFVVNVSSPNTPGLRELQGKESLQKILSNLQSINQGKLHPKPLLLKIAPDLNQSQIDDIVAIAEETQLNGIVATNTTISRDNLVTNAKKIEAIGNGGLSGKPVQKMSTEILKMIEPELHRKNISVVASGGIFTGADAKEKIDLGADLIQIWTGFIYEGPFIVKNICEYLLSH